jgi:PAS domain S-box-containing protein
MATSGIIINSGSNQMQNIKKSTNKPDGLLKPPKDIHLNSYQTYHEFADNISDCVYCLNTDGYFTFVNKALVEKAGFSQEQFFNLHFLDLVTSEQHDLAKNNFDRVMQGKNGIPYELKYKNANGQYRFAEVHSRPICEGKKVVGFLSISRDITERREMEDVLKASESRFRSLIETIHIGVVIYEGTKIRYLNPACEKITGYTIDELYLNDIWEIAHPEFKDVIKELVHRRQRKKPVPEVYDFKIITKSREERWLERGGTAIEFDGETAVLVTIIDITDRKNAEEKLKKYSDLLEELVKERTSELDKINDQLLFELVERKRAESALIEKSQELENHVNKLEELNAAMKFLLKQRDEDKGQLEERVILNVKELLLPYLEALKKSPLDAKPKDLVSILESNLNDIISPFAHTISSKYMSFTPREIQVADLIRQGKSTKEIANIMGISNGSIIIHRNHIRKKLGIISKKINLRSHLMSLS